MTPEQKLTELGLELPTAAPPVGRYAPAVQAGGLVFTAGQLPMAGGSLSAEGKVPGDVTVDLARAAARLAALNALSAVRGLVGSLDSVVRVVRLNVYVNSSPGFTDQAAVANGASELVGEVFGDPGRHSRCAIGAAELPLNAPVELDMVVEVK